MQEQSGVFFLKAIEGLAPWLPGAVGAAFSLRFIEGSKWQKLTSFMLGVACAGYIGGWLIEALDVQANSLSARGISFAVGLFGFALVLHATQQIPELFKVLLDWFKNTLDRLTPGGK